MIEVTSQLDFMSRVFVAAVAQVCVFVVLLVSSNYGSGFEFADQRHVLFQEEIYRKVFAVGAYLSCYPDKLVFQSDSWRRRAASSLHERETEWIEARMLSVTMSQNLPCSQSLGHHIESV
jgi:hypothetical protein